MKKLFSLALAALVAGTLVTAAACNDEPASLDGVNLVAVTAAEVGVRSDVDYFVIPEPAASTKVGAIESLKFAGDLQELYGGDKGYPQAVVVVKNELLSYVGETFSSALKENREWLLSEDTSAQEIVSVVQSHLDDGLTPTFNANNLSKQVIENCGINFASAAGEKEAILSFMQQLNAVSDTSFGIPADGFFASDADLSSSDISSGATGSDSQVYDGKISVYAPDGAPALGLAQLMADDDFYNGQVEFKIVNADLIQTYVGGNDPAADICVLPVNAAVKLLGDGTKYKMLGTLTHGNLYIVSGSGETVTSENISVLAGKTVGVVNLAAVPGLTFKVILEKYDLDYTVLQ